MGHLSLKRIFVIYREEMSNQNPSRFHDILTCFYSGGNSPLMLLEPSLHLIHNTILRKKRMTGEFYFI